MAWWPHPNAGESAPARDIKSPPSLASTCWFCQQRCESPSLTGSSQTLPEIGHQRVRICSDCHGLIRGMLQLMGGMGTSTWNVPLHGPVQRRCSFCDRERDDCVHGNALWAWQDDEHDRIGLWADHPADHTALSQVTRRRFLYCPFLCADCAAQETRSAGRTPRP